MNNLDYGIIGNCQSAALISKFGSLDWCCLPNFDSYSVFAKILDEDKGGSFEILVSEDYNVSQKYIEKTNILVTEFNNGKDVFEFIDFMPRYKNEDGTFYAPSDIVRYIKYISGKPTFRIKYDPKLEYAMGKTNHELKKDFIKSITNEE